MSNTRSETLDRSLPGAFQGATFQRIEALIDQANVLTLYASLPKLLAQIDADDATTSNYATTCTPASPADVLTAWNALLAKLDTDAKPAGSNYAALLGVSVVQDIPGKWLALLAKLDADDNTDNTYTTDNGGVVFLKTVDDA